MFTDTEIQQIENVIYNVLKNENILQKKTGQTTLDVQTEISIEECDEDYMIDKSIACWWFSNNEGKVKGVRHDQLFIFGNGKFNYSNTKVLKPLPFTFEEAYKVWESHFIKKLSVTDIFTDIAFRFNPTKSDIQFIIWALLNGKCEWMLKGTRDDRYDFDFKKYIGWEQ